MKSLENNTWLAPLLVLELAIVEDVLPVIVYLVALNFSFRKGLKNVVILIDRETHVDDIDDSSSFLDEQIQVTPFLALNCRQTSG